MYIQTIKARVSGVRSEFKDGIWQGIKAEDEATFEDRQILYPESGYELEKNGERFSCVWLKDGDSPENYTEVEAAPEPDEENAEE
jgi:hypothetical protein